MVGLGRLELPTSRLSSARSNQLSYKPEPFAQPRAPLKASKTGWQAGQRLRGLVQKERETKAAKSRKMAF